MQRAFNLPASERCVGGARMISGGIGPQLDDGVELGVYGFDALQVGIYHL